MKKLIVMMLMLPMAVFGQTDMETEWETKVIRDVPSGALATMLERFDRTWPTAAVGDVCQVMALGVDKKVFDTDDGYTVEVDWRNGFVQSYTEGSDRETMSACTWRRTDGHRLLAIVVSHVVDPAQDDIYFYDYDPQQHTLTPEPELVEMVFNPMFPTAYVSYTLPREGKDLIVEEYSSMNTYRKIYKWDGMAFSYDRTEKESLFPGEDDSEDDDEIIDNCREEDEEDYDDPLAFLRGDWAMPFIRKNWADMSEEGPGRLQVKDAQVKDLACRLAVTFCSAFAIIPTNQQLASYFLEPEAFIKDLFRVESDPRNGYVRCAMLTEVFSHTDVCYWNRKNGHKLVAVYMEDNHEAEDESDHFVVFYDYDPATSIMTAEPALTTMIEERVADYDNYEVRLPQTGKDIELFSYILNHETEEGYHEVLKLVWDGMTFSWGAVERR